MLKLSCFIIGSAIFGITASPVSAFNVSVGGISVLSLDSDEPISALGYLNGALAQSISFPSGSNYQVYEVELGNIGGSQLFDRVVLNTISGSPENPLSGGPELFDNLTITLPTLALFLNP